MQTLQEATKNICRLEGSSRAQLAFLKALIRAIPHEAIEQLQHEFAATSEDARTSMLGQMASEHLIETLDRDLQLLAEEIRAHS